MVEGERVHGIGLDLKALDKIPGTMLLCSHSQRSKADSSSLLELSVTPRERSLRHSRGHRHNRPKIEDKYPVRLPG